MTKTEPQNPRYYVIERKRNGETCWWIPVAGPYPERPIDVWKAFCRAYENTPWADFQIVSRSGLCRHGYPMTDNGERNLHVAIEQASHDCRFEPGSRGVKC